MPDYSQAINHFVDRLMIERGFDLSDTEAKEKFKMQALENINRYIISRIPDDKLDEFGELLEENNPEKISYFIEEAIGSVEDAVNESLN